MAKGRYRDWLTPDSLAKIEAWAKDGLTDAQIAHNMGIGLTAFYTWRKSYPDIADALKKGKAVADVEVENALYKKAIGYRYEEVTKMPVYDKDGTPIQGDDGTPKMCVAKITIKYAHPDTTAQIFWLKNRRPDKWCSDPHTLSIKREELDIKKQKADADSW